MRIGKQPYGMLPVVAPTVPARAATSFERQAAGLLSLLRPFWRRGLGKVPRIGVASRAMNLDETLLKILQTTPLSSSARFRRVIGSATAGNTQGLKQYEDIQADVLDTIVGRHFRLGPSRHASPSL